MTYSTVIKNPLFGNQEVRIWSTSKRSFNKYFSKTLEMYKLLENTELDINLSPIEHIEIIRSTIKFYFQSNVSECIYDFMTAKHRIICNNNELTII